VSFRRRLRYLARLVLIRGWGDICVVFRSGSLGHGQSVLAKRQLRIAVGPRPIEGQSLFMRAKKKTLVNWLIKQAKGRTAIDASLFDLQAIIGMADLVDVVPLNQELEANEWAEGPCCYMLEKAQLLAEPIPFNGKLNVFS